MLLDTLLARATGLPGFEMWRGLAPRRFLIQDLLAEVIRAMEALPVSKAHGTFAVVTTSALGLPGTLPAGWAEVASQGDHFAIFRAPVGTTTRQAIETLALELIPLFYPSEYYEQKLYDWLVKELDVRPGDDEEGASTEAPGPDGPAPLGPVRCLDIPAPSSYHNIKSEAEQDLDFLYGNGTTPPEYHGYRRDCAAQEDFLYGPPEVSDYDLQLYEEASYL